MWSPREPTSSPPHPSNSTPRLPPFLPSMLLSLQFFFYFLPLSNSFPLLYSAGELDERTSASLWEVPLGHMTDPSPLLGKWIHGTHTQVATIRCCTCTPPEIAGCSVESKNGDDFFSQDFQRFNKCVWRFEAEKLIYIQAFTNSCHWDFLFFLQSLVPELLLKLFWRGVYSNSWSCWRMFVSAVELYCVLLTGASNIYPLD